MYILRSSNYSGLKSNAHFQINRKLVLHNNIFHEIITDTANGQILKKTDRIHSEKKMELLVK